MKKNIKNNLICQNKNSEIKLMMNNNILVINNKI